MIWRRHSYLTISQVSRCNRVPRAFGRHLRNAPEYAHTEPASALLNKTPAGLLRPQSQSSGINLRTVKPLRQRPGFQSNSLESVGRVLQHRQQRFWFARHFHFPNDLAQVIHNADAGLLDRYVQSSKMVHAALLLLMLEVANARRRFTISLKRSTQNLQLSTSSPADYHL
jgi:hypothetical protein